MTRKSPWKAGAEASNDQAGNRAAVRAMEASMPKDENAASGPYYVSGSMLCQEMGGNEYWIALFEDTLASSTVDEVINLLNKGTHAERLAGALRHARDNCIGHPDQMIEEALAAYDGRARAPTPRKCRECYGDGELNGVGCPACSGTGEIFDDG